MIQKLLAFLLAAQKRLPFVLSPQQTLIKQQRTQMSRQLLFLQSQSNPRSGHAYSSFHVRHRLYVPKMSTLESHTRSKCIKTYEISKRSESGSGGKSERKFLLSGLWTWLGQVSRRSASLEISEIK